MSDYLYHTTTPILLDGKKTAGLLAKNIWRAYGLTSHWFGCGRHYLLTAYAQKHTLPHSPSTMPDDLLTQILIDFAKEQPMQQILVLVPCSTDAADYMSRQKDKLETYFLLFDRDVPMQNPLLLLTKH